MERSDWNFSISCCRDVIVAMKTAESLSHSVLVPLSFAYLWVMFQAKILHINLRFFLIAYSFNDFVIAANRIPDIVKNDGLLVESSFIRTIKFTGWIMGVVILLDIMMERVVAFAYFQKYDEWSNKFPIAALSLLVAEYTAIGLLGFAVTQDWVSFDNFVLVLFLLSIITYLIFPFSQWMIMKKIRKREKDRFELRFYNVNGRFQIHELRRSVEMLRNYVVFQGFAWFIAVTVASYFQFFVLPNHPEYAVLAEQIGNLINSPRAVISMLIPLTYHTGIRETLQRILKDKIDPGTIQSLNGEQLRFTREQERDLYFAALKTSWN